MCRRHGTAHAAQHTRPPAAHAAQHTPPPAAHAAQHTPPPAESAPRKALRGHRGKRSAAHAPPPPAESAPRPPAAHLASHRLGVWYRETRRSCTPAWRQPTPTPSVSRVPRPTSSWPPGAEVCRWPRALGLGHTWSLQGRIGRGSGRIPHTSSLAGQLTAPKGRIPHTSSLAGHLPAPRPRPRPGHLPAPRPRPRPDIAQTADPTRDIAHAGRPREGCIGRRLLVHPLITAWRAGPGPCRRPRPSACPPRCRRSPRPTARPSRHPPPPSPAPRRPSS